MASSLVWGRKRALYVGEGSGKEGVIGDFARLSLLRVWAGSGVRRGQCVAGGFLEEGAQLKRDCPGKVARGCSWKRKQLTKGVFV